MLLHEDLHIIPSLHTQQSIRIAFYREFPVNRSLCGTCTCVFVGAIAGACYGIEEIPVRWQKVCEGVDDALRYAEEMHALHQARTVTSSNSAAPTDSKT